MQRFLVGLGLAHLALLGVAVQLLRMAISIASFLDQCILHEKT